MLKVTKETKGSSGVPIPAPTKLVTPDSRYPTGYKFPVSYLDKVTFDPEKEIKSDEGTEKKPVLGFVFRDKKDRQYTFLEFPVDPDDKDKDVKEERLVRRIKHIWDETIGEDKFSDMAGETYDEFFKNVENAFNAITIKAGENKTATLYSKTPLYTKLIYVGDKLKFPLFPNFLQRAKKDGNIVPCETLLINPTYDKIEPVAAQKNNSTMNVLDNNFDGADIEMDEEFPDV